MGDDEVSYFVFGTIELTDGCEPSTAEVRIRELASRAGIWILLRAEVRQAVVLEMLASSPHRGAAPFMLAAAPGDDTSDDLVSPFSHGLDGTLDAMRAIAGWLTQIVERDVAACVRVWMTEGYDDRFADVSCTARAFEHQVTTRIRTAEDVPSLRVTIRTPAATSTVDPP